MKIYKGIFLLMIFIILVGCQSIKSEKYTAAPKKVSISGTKSSGYTVDSITLKEEGIAASSEAVDFCFSQNIPNIEVSPSINPSKNKITAQGSEQISFIVPRTMGTPLNFELFFSATTEIKPDKLYFYYKKLKIRGTWTNNKNPLPGSQEAHRYVDSSLEELENISNNIANCMREES